MLVVGAAFRLYHLKLLGGVTAAILYLSPTYLSESGALFGGIPSFLESLVDWGALLMLLRATTHNKPRLRSLIVVAVAGVMAYLVTGKRSAIVPFLIYPIV